MKEQDKITALEDIILEERTICREKEKMLSDLLLLGRNLKEYYDSLQNIKTKIDRFGRMDQKMEYIFEGLNKLIGK